MNDETVNRRLPYITDQFQIRGGDAGLHVLVFDADVGFAGLLRKAQIDLDDAGRGFSGCEGGGEIGSFQSPGIALPLTVRIGRLGGDGAFEREGVAAVHQPLMPYIQQKIVEKMGVAIAGELDEAIVGLDGHFLRIRDHQLRRLRLHMLYLAVFIAGDAEMFVVRKGLAAPTVFAPILCEPLFIGADRIVHPDEDELHIGRDVGLKGFEEKGGSGKNGFREAECRVPDGVAALGAVAHKIAALGAVAHKIAASRAVSSLGKHA